MKEYIERAALIDDFEHCGASKEIVDAIVYRINLHNAADVAEVRHGRWIMRGGKFRCSECGAKAAWEKEGGTGGFSSEYTQVKSPCCPNCGARMDEEAKIYD